MIIMLSRSYDDNLLVWTICHMWSRECYSIMFMFQSCQTVCISLSHREVHSVHSKWVTMILMLSRHYDNPLLWTIWHMWSGECYSIMLMFQSCQTVCISLNHWEVHSVHSKWVTMILMLAEVMIIHCCGQSVTCGVENVTASCLCFRVVKLFVSH
jgi:hypothetical protein